ncbi:MAG: hypothetical protein ACFFAS_13295 [Promethearchaeota archaeon]
MYKIVGREIIPTDEKKLEKDKIYIIIDKHTKKSKIWIWSGSEAKNMDRYFAGVSATKIKSKKRLYGASIEVVEQDHEPGHFPDLSAIEIKEPSKDKIEMEKVIVPLSTEIHSKAKVVPRIKQDIEKMKTPEIQQPILDKSKEELSNLKSKISSLLNEVASDLKKLQEKISNFFFEI